MYLTLPTGILSLKLNLSFMQRYSFLAAVLICLLAACHNQPNTPATVKTTGPVSQLSPAAIYSFDTVVSYLRQAKTSQADTGKSVFLQAIDVYKNQKNAAGSITLFEQSLRFYPNNKGYYELGNALLDANKDSLAFRAFDMAEKLNYNPLSYVLFKKACCLANADENDFEKHEAALNYLKNAIENGFADRDRIYNDPKLATLRKSDDFTAVYNDAMSGNGDPASVLWDSYSNGFQPTSFPMTINMETLKNIKQPNAISYDFEKYVTEMRDFKFSRDVGEEFFYFAKVNETPNYETVIYGSRSYDLGEDMPYTPTRFYLASYSKQGKLIDKVELAGQQAFDQLFKVATVQQNLNFEIKEYKNTWAKPAGDDGYAGNKIVKSDLVKTSRYKIGENGKFVSDAQLLGMVDGTNDKMNNKYQ